ncbi:hypothetical protein [Streptomyces sp. NPDC057552]|uniref:hypothetical protein n=1 Tax=Streptomyces sp. NPDC057552 TaxID=3350537 RepID=UPI00368DA180
MTDTPMTPDREQEIRETHPAGWYDGPWTHNYVEGEGGEPDYWRVVHHESGTTLATLPDWAGGLAAFIADAHDAVPELLAEVDRLRARAAELEDRPARTEVLDEAAAHFDSSVEGRFVTKYFGHQVAAELKAMRVDRSAPCEEFRQDGECSCPTRHTTR